MNIMKGKYYSTKLFDLGSTAFRQFKAQSHCKYIHGYNLKAKVIFGCSELDDNNWCVDFGGFKTIKEILRNQFDHTTVVASDEPQLNLFNQLHDANVIDLRIMVGGVGLEKFAEWVFKTVDTQIQEQSDERCFVESVEIFEHDINSAIFQRTPDLISSGIIEGVVRDSLPSLPEPVVEAPTEPMPPINPSPRAAPVGGGNVTPGMGNPFGGTSWGNS